jgi:hypothetical protein
MRALVRFSTPGLGRHLQRLRRVENRPEPQSLGIELDVDALYFNPLA